MTRIEQILKAAIDGQQVDFAPLSREEVLLIQLSQKMAAGGADPETIRNAVDEYLRNNPIGLDPTLADPTKAAPANIVGEIKDDISKLLDTSKPYTEKGSFANLIYETLGLYVDENGDIAQKEE